MLLVMRWTCSFLLSLIVILSLETVRTSVYEFQTLSTAPPRRTTLRTARPRNLRLVFLGDSLTRYQYLSLAYYLRHGQWFDPVVTVHNLVSAHSFHQAGNPNDDWNEFFGHSNRMLYPLEVCDCLRSRNEEILVERRYFYDATHNNALVYINMNGNKTVRDRGYYGRLNPRDIFGPNFDRLVGLPFGLDMASVDHLHAPDASQWEYPTWAEVIRHHIGELDWQFGKESTLPVRVILNAGIHPHDFDTPDTVRDVAQALDDMHMPGYWKTTTYSRAYTMEYQTDWFHAERLNIKPMDDAVVRSDMGPLSAVPGGPIVRSADEIMCKTLEGCIDLSWTARLRPELFIDNLHVSEPVYRIWNEELLEQLGELPPHYVKLDRSAVLMDTVSPHST